MANFVDVKDRLFHQIQPRTVPALGAWEGMASHLQTLGEVL